MKLTAAEHLAYITHALEQGHSYRAIGQELGCNHMTVGAFAKLHCPDLRRKLNDPPQLATQRAMRMLVIDIETRPNLAHVWGIWDQNVGLNQLLESAEMICFAAKWYGEPLVRFKSVFHDGQEAMVDGAWQLLDRADVVMHYNGKRFDVPHLNREFLQHGHTPPSPYKQIDLYQVVKRQFAFPSYKLAYVAPALGLEDKGKHEGHELWVKCMNGDKAAWGRMADYNRQDVLLTEQLYEALIPWIQNHPSHGAYTSADVCPNCGSEDLQHRGTTYTKVSSFVRLQCQSCGKWSRTSKREGRTGVTEVTG